MEKTIGENLRVLRLRNNLSMKDAGMLLGTSAPAILKYERNLIMPNLERLVRFAEIYNCTVDDILDTGISCDIKFANFKCQNRTSDITKEKIQNYLKCKIANYFDLLKNSNIKLQNKFGVHMINTLEESESLATKLRIFFTIPLDAPISNLIYLLESNGIIIITVPKEGANKNFVGFYEIINNVPVIAVPRADNGYDQRFNIAKYLGELLIVADKNKDALTTRFALSLLIPKQGLINEFDKSRIKVDFKEIEIFSNIYKVSYKNVLNRLEMCKIITPSNAKYASIYINKNAIKEQIYIEEAYNYNKMLYKLYAKGIIEDLNKYI